MATLNNMGYLEVRGKTTWLIKHHYHMPNKNGQIHIGTANFPKHLIGRRVRFKIEVIGHDEN